MLRIAGPILRRHRPRPAPGRRVPFGVDSPWFTGSAEISTFALEELLGTKLRALYQRKKGRDLDHLGVALAALSIDDAQVVGCFERYMQHRSLIVRRDEFESNLSDKLRDQGFLGDVGPLLSHPSTYDARVAAEVVMQRLVAKLPERPRKSKPRRS